MALADIGLAVVRIVLEEARKVLDHKAQASHTAAVAASHILHILWDLRRRVPGRSVLAQAAACRIVAARRRELCTPLLSGGCLEAFGRAVVMAPVVLSERCCAYAYAPDDVECACRRIVYDRLMDAMNLVFEKLQE